MHEKGRRLTIVGVVEVDDFLPAVISHRVDDSAMIIRTHTYGEIQETWGRCQNLKHVGRTFTFTLSTFRFYSVGGTNRTENCGDAWWTVERRRFSERTRRGRKRRQCKCNRKYLRCCTVARMLVSSKALCYVISDRFPSFLSPLRSNQPI